MMKKVHAVIQHHFPESFCPTFFKKLGRIFKGATLETGCLRAVAFKQGFGDRVPDR